MDDRLKELRLRRGNFKGQLTRFLSFLQGIESQDVKKVSEISFRITKIEQIFTNFETVQSQIEALDPDNSDEHLAERLEFEDKYFAALASAKEIMDQYKVSVSPGLAPLPDRTEHSDQQGLSPYTKVKLPQLSLPEFSGSYDKWTQFYETFKTLIDENSSLNSITKFYYLQAALKGEAAQVISSLEVNASNYSVAWDLLKARFENKRFIVKTHVKGIFDLANVSKDSHISLRQFFDNFLKNYRVLKNLGEPVQHWDTLLLYLLTSKLDINSKREWEIHTNNEVSPKMETFINFLTGRCHLLESLDNRGSYNRPDICFNKGSSDSRSHAHLATNNDHYKTAFKCILCKGDHQLFKCGEFLKLPINARINEVKRLKACVNCLRPGHLPSQCRFGFCRVCHKKHNSLLHLNSHRNQSDTQETPRDTPESNTPVTQPSIDSCDIQSDNPQNTNRMTTVNTYCANNSFVLLSTAQLYIFDRFNKPTICRAIIDSGSQCCFISSELCHRLQLNPDKTKMPIVGINSICTNINARVQAKIKSIASNFSTVLDFWVIDKITDKLPQIAFDISSLNIPEGLTLADPSFNKPGKVDILLGASIFFDLLLSGRFKTFKGGPNLHSSKLGWIIAGPLDISYPHSSSCNLYRQDLRDQIEHFWLLEEADKKEVVYSKEELEVEEHFCQTFKKDKNGRFVVRLPFRDNYTSLENNLENAQRRFIALERKLNKNSNLRSEYSAFMKEYIGLGHMTQFFPQNNCNNQIMYYLPHHCIIKETSLTTKLRVVFDASCKSETKLSLNDVLKTGPCIQEDIFSILSRFRTHNIAFTSDITKMYRQILVHEQDRNFQGILWRFNPLEDLKHYLLNTVTYGTASASFLATRCLKQLAIENQISFSKASLAIQTDFYMDDWIGGTSDSESAIKLIQEVTSILSSSGFILRQWITNDMSVLKGVPLGSNDLQYNFKDHQSSSKTLGVHWNASRDCFNFIVQPRLKSTVTKRSILSIIAQIFDPLGLIGPVILTSKLIMQDIWKIKSDWDDPIPAEIEIKWATFFDHLRSVQSLDIPRKILLTNAYRIELHCFTDASQVAYGTCIYARSTDIQGNILVRLICSKSRTAPLKLITLPRLELCGALLGAQLTKRVISSLRLDIADIIYWCDSSIVLAWIASEPSKLKTFVSNRIAQIQSLTLSNQWRYVPSSENVADYISRGVQPHEIKDLASWWKGPNFLMHDLEWWPSALNFTKIALPETKEISLIMMQTKVNDDFISRLSSLKMLIRVTSYINRFINNCRTDALSRKTGELAHSELDHSIKVLTRIVQGQEFFEELQSLKKSKQVPKGSKLYNLNPFLDDFGIIRVGGRINKSNTSFDFKHPMIIPAKHHLTTLIIRYEHARNLHAGIQAVLASVRSRFWPLNGRQTVRRILHKCIICFKVKPQYLNQIMGQLPSSRVTPSRPFSICGVDFAGPYLIKDSKFRNKKLIKAYVCIFVCFASKAIHLELVSDMTTEAFLNTLKRFVSRRGLCSHMYSDNGTNFVGADKHLKQFLTFAKNPEIRNYLLDSRITWHFIPPRSPHFGGLWESAVKCMKFHLRRIIYNMTMTFEELYTYLTQVECVLNSRPICPLTDDANDTEPLTPGHFLIGSALNSLPEEMVPDVRSTHVNRYKLLQLLLQQFWHKWSANYLHTLQQLSKWRTSNVPESLIGSLVILHEDNIPPMAWRMGRIVEVYPGSDGLVRVVSVKTSHGIVKRSITKISILPLETYEDST